MMSICLSHSRQTQRGLSLIELMIALGLGLFIAKTLLERSGAQLEFRNKSYPKRGAVVAIKWSRATLDGIE